MDKISVGESGVTAFAPATIGNVSCGFDLLGLAVNEPGDYVNVNLNYDRKVNIIRIDGDGGKLPLDVDKNTAGMVVKALKKHIQKSRGLDIILKKDLPICSGMGSSAASAVAALVAANEIYGNKLTKEELIPFALQAEAKVSGSVHGDNALPCLLGGIILITGYKPKLKYVRIPVPKKVWVTLVHPDFEISTAMARDLIPESLEIKKVIKQNACLAGFIAGCYSNNLDLIKNGLKDYIAEPKRAKLIKSFPQMKMAVEKIGGFNLGISGSGPSVFSFTSDKNIATKVGRTVQKFFYQNKVNCQIYISRINKEGATVVKSAANKV